MPPLIVIQASYSCITFYQYVTEKENTRKWHATLWMLIYLGVSGPLIQYLKTFKKFSHDVDNSHYEPVPQ